jgi:hypothetical protein
VGEHEFYVLVFYYKLLCCASHFYCQSSSRQLDSQIQSGIQRIWNNHCTLCCDALYFASILNLSLLGDLFRLTRSGFASLLTLAAKSKSTAFNLHATSSLRTLDVPPGIEHLTLQLSFFSFHHWRWQ